jgi:hypothetical protein
MSAPNHAIFAAHRDEQPNYICLNSSKWIVWGKLCAYEQHVDPITERKCSQSPQQKTELHNGDTARKFVVTSASVDQWFVIALWRNVEIRLQISAMDEIVLVDDMEIESPVFDVAATTHHQATVTGTTTVAENGNRTGKSGAPPIATASWQHPVPGTGEKRGSDGVTSVIMLYSPDIPACSVGGRLESRPSIANYYSLIEIEETMKCVVSTTLFFLVLVAFALIALLMNPEM